jgi:hypothetical protein
VFDRHIDDVVADRQALAVLQPVGALHPLRGAVDEDAVGRNVVEPVAIVLVADFAMAAGNVAARIGQRPVEMLFASDLEAAVARLERVGPPSGSESMLSMVSVIVMLERCPTGLDHLFGIGRDGPVNRASARCVSEGSDRSRPAAAAFTACRRESRSVMTIRICSRRPACVTTFRQG